MLNSKSWTKEEARLWKRQGMRCQYLYKSQPQLLNTLCLWLLITLLPWWHESFVNENSNKNCFMITVGFPYRPNLHTGLFIFFFSWLLGPFLVHFDRFYLISCFFQRWLLKPFCSQIEPNSWLKGLCKSALIRPKYLVTSFAFHVPS